MATERTFRQNFIFNALIAHIPIATVRAIISAYCSSLECSKTLIMQTNIASVMALICLDDERIAYIRGNGDVHIRNVESQQTEQLQEPSLGMYMPLALALFDQNKLAVATCGAGVCMWNHMTGKYLGLLGSEYETMLCVATLPHRKLAAGTRNGAVYVWDILNGEKCVLPHYELVAGMRFNHSVQQVFALPHDRLVSRCSDGILRLWDLKSETCTAQIACDKNEPSFVHFAREEVIYTQDLMLRVWNLLTGEGNKVPGFSRGSIPIGKWPSGELIVRARDSDFFILWNMQDGAQTRTALCGGNTSKMAKTPNGLVVLATNSKSGSSMFVWK